ncbi:MAG: hypothetical protein U0800_06915 [Isosphaeraceae bacterium]
MPSTQGPSITVAAIGAGPAGEGDGAGDGAAMAGAGGNRSARLPAWIQPA